jgi:tRNA pseudouridine synthase 10
MKKNIQFFLEKIINDLKEFEFNTFLIAIISGNEKNNDEEKPLKKNLGELLAKQLKKAVDFDNPDILIQIDKKTNKINYQIKSLYIYGRYQKIKPGIPQTRWHKKRYPTSVQEEIGHLILEETKGDDHSFHGCGREDVDAMMVGEGRPFVLEIKNPKIRQIDLKKIEEKINQESNFAKVSQLSFTNKEKIIELKLAQPDKIYQVEIILEKESEKEVLENACKKLSKITINQQTPTRVLDRRYDKLRQRKVYYTKLVQYHPISPIMEIKAESGTYIKELIHGDNGRTQPSLSQILNQKTKVKQLTVKEILI